jgi:NAD(P)-dependent dehydrogenase (short-subunit alcohol dehydrogenase family)
VGGGLEDEMDLMLSGRSAIVTGASRGIGAAVAAELAREGVDVALIARDRETLERVARDLSARYRVRAWPISADLTNVAELDAAFTQAGDRLGRVDILINNAGASPSGTFDQIDDRAWTAAYELKLLGYVRAIRAVLPEMRFERHGRIVNVVGMAGRYATPGYVLGAFNAALLHLTKALAQDLAPAGIGVVAVNPTNVETDRLMATLRKRAQERGQDLAAFRSELAASVPMRRFASAEEISRLIVFMASDVAAYVVGSALQADGAVSTGVM